MRHSVVRGGRGDERFSRVYPANEAELLFISKQLGQKRIANWFWEDSFRVTPQTLTLGFVALFCNPANEVYLLPYKGGVAVFAEIKRSWRALLYAAVWDTRVSHRADLWRLLCGAVMYTHDLLVIDAIVNERNRACQRAVQRAGFEKVGTLKSALCYSNRVVDASWYSLHRDALRIGTQRGLEVANGQQEVRSATSDPGLREVRANDAASVARCDELQVAARADTECAIRCG